MKYFFPLMSMLFLCLAMVQAQEKKSVQALYIESPLNIDGILDEPAYGSADIATDFVQIEPYNGQPAYQRTEVYFFYDQTALYIGALLYDSSPDSIYNFLSERDDIGSSDFFGVYIDPYNQGQLAYGFYITPAGVQRDLKAYKSNGDSEDGNWNAVWECKTAVNEQGWVVEMRIPYSELRFSKEAGEAWGLNLVRGIRRYNSTDSWNLIDNKVAGYIDQQGQMTGIKNISPPVRLSLTPYAAAYAEFQEKNSSPDFTYKGGMDLKYGISEGFTLDMMLIPDFGQIQSDDKQLNLSPYELYYSEKRQFFTEGTELFDRAGIFYSRRIGASPKFSGKANDETQENEVVEYNPTETQLINATKVSGRTSGGWGLGMLNAMTLPSKAVLKDTLTGNKRDVLVQPFTNYNISVVDKTLPNNSYISLINSNVAMANNPFIANVIGTDFQFRNKAKTYALTGKVGVSVRGEEDKETGYYFSLGLGKNSGKWRYGLSQVVNSDKFNINDLGYMRRNNEMTTEAYLSYRILEPVSIFREIYTSLWYDHLRIVRPNKPYINQAGFYIYAMFMNNYGIQLNINGNSYKHDYYEPRVEGRYYYEPASYNLNVYAHSDSRKALIVNLWAGVFNQPATDQNSHYGGSNLNLRVGRRFKINYSFQFQKDYNDFGYVDRTSSNDTIYFARRNVKTFENVIGSSFILTNNAGINLRIRHYWSGDANKDYYQLQPDGTLMLDAAYDKNKDENFNSLNIDFTFRWIFAPGSELNLVWKNSILDSGDEVVGNYLDNLSNTLRADQTNSFSIKVLYYIDYNNLRKKNRP